jgi:hypothetical protein
MQSVGAQPISPVICQYLLEDLEARPLVQMNRLIPISFLHSLRYLLLLSISSSAPIALVHVCIFFAHIKVRVMQHFLDEILQFCSSSLVLFGMILNHGGMMLSLAENTLAPSALSGGKCPALQHMNFSM